MFQSHYNKHLTYSDRLKIEALHLKRHTKREIAEVIGCSYETIRRELLRGKYERLDGQTWLTYTAYSADIAQNDYDSKATAKGRDIKLGTHHDYANYIEQKIMKEKYSVDAALYAAEYEDYGIKISRTTIYRYINDGIFLKLSNKHLPQGKRSKGNPKYYRKPSRAPYRSIEQRKITRDDFGHWEMDTVVGKAKGKSECLLVLTERQTREELVIKMRAKTAENTVKALNSLCHTFESAFSKVFRSITMDNGSEFADAKGIETYKDKQRTTVFYCHPYSSYERGSNECANKLIRRHVPKGTSMVGITRKKAKEIQDWMNNYPRPMFSGKTSNELFFDALRREGIEISPAFYTVFS